MHMYMCIHTHDIYLCNVCMCTCVHTNPRPPTAVQVAYRFTDC